MAIRMAGMIGLQYSKGPQSRQRDERLTRNDLRLRLCLILQESRLVLSEPPVLRRSRPDGSR